MRSWTSAAKSPTLLSAKTMKTRIQSTGPLVSLWESPNSVNSGNGPFLSKEAIPCMLKEAIPCMLNPNIVPSENEIHSNETRWWYDNSKNFTK